MFLFRNRQSGPSLLFLLDPSLAEAHASRASSKHSSLSGLSLRTSGPVTITVMAKEVAYDPRFYCFRRCQSCKIHVIQRFRGRESRRFLKWFATVKSGILGPASAPLDGGYGQRDTHARSFKYVKRDVLLNFGDNNVYQVPLELRKVSPSGERTDLCNDEAVGVIILCKPFPQLEDIMRYVNFLDERYNDNNSSDKTRKRPMLVLFTGWDKFFYYYSKLHPRENHNFISLFFHMVLKIGAHVDQNTVCYRLKSGSVVQFGICPVGQEASFANSVLGCVYKFAYMITTEMSYQSALQERNLMEKFLRESMNVTRSMNRSLQSLRSANDSADCEGTEQVFEGCTVEEMPKVTEKSCTPGSRVQGRGG